MDDARRALDARLGVPAWGVAGVLRASEQERDPSAPYWWSGAENASQSFLSSMGVAL